jgi:hypothetical protein
MFQANDSSASGTNGIAQSAEADAIRSRIAELREARRESQTANICYTEPVLTERFDGQQSLRVLQDFMQHHVSPASDANGTLGGAKHKRNLASLRGGLTDRNLWSPAQNQ